MTITIPGQIIKMDTPSGIDPVWYDKLKAIFASVSLFDSLFGTASGSSSHIKASLGSDVALSGTGSYFDGPSIAQGTTGTWWVAGMVTLTSSTQDNFRIKLWDGTTVIASAQTTNTGTASFFNTVSLSGFLANPAGNLRISVNDPNSTNGVIKFNQSGNSKDSTISAFRIA